MSTITQKVEGSLFPQTTTVYRCSNDACQQEKDNETKKRLTLLKEKAENEKTRTEERKLKRQTIMQQKRV
jgi:hypothetical protein